MTQAKDIIFGKEARNKIIEGVKILSQAVTTTLGPRARNVIIKREYGGPLVVHDGVTVAKNVILKDPVMDIGAQLLLQAAFNTNSEAGDGTTTATLLASNLIIEGEKITSKDIMNGKLGSVNPMELQVKLNDYAEKICQKLASISIPAKTRRIYERVAVISSASEKIGKMVADAVEAVGVDGVIMVEKNRGIPDELEIKRGFDFDRGYLSPYFVTNLDRYTVEYDNTLILVCDYTIRNADPIANLVQSAFDLGKSVLIIAETVEGAALAALANINLKTPHRIAAVSAPEFADTRRQMLEDIALATGARFISSELGDKLEDVTISDLGKASSVFITQTETRIAPEIMDDDLKERVLTIKQQIKDETNDIKKGKLEKRLGMLSQTVSIITVGGSSDAEVHERYERYIDAVNSTKAAIRDGILAGGGVALMRVARDMFSGDSPEEVLVANALTAPIKTLITNSGLELSILDKIDNKNINYTSGVNVVTGEIVDMLEAGIIDPVKVTSSAVRNAFSVAGITLTTEVTITDLESDVQKMEIVK